MKTKVKVTLISAGIVVALVGIGAAILIHGAYDYVSRCAHIKDHEGVECAVGDTLDIDDLAEFSNYDERRITGIIGAEGEISEDKQSVTITSGEGAAEVCVFATNDEAPEWTSHEIKILIKGNKG
ncbi:hypothetical protein SAMN02910456_01474 [Ruminococcaceae bacterium YRB3002]|nr:hypothetical protein SAMN02910456_01474 [Ruminococcaceae bacterium YRB3002]